MSRYQQAPYSDTGAGYGNSYANNAVGGGQGGYSSGGQGGYNSGYPDTPSGGYGDGGYDKYGGGASNQCKFNSPYLDRKGVRECVG